MNLPEFRRLVRQEFGHELQYLTPANAREFLDRVQPRVDQAPAPGGRIVLKEEKTSYESIVRDFLAKVLEMPADQAVIRLWLFSLELSAATVNDLEAEKFERLFAQLLAE